jgi:hypothetical protein
MSSQEERAAAVMKTLTDKLATMTGSLKNWGKSINLCFSETDYGYNIKFAMDGTVEKIEKVTTFLLKKKGAAATLNATTSTWESILDGTIKAEGALTGGLVKIDGAVDAVMKLAAAFPQ